MWKNGEYTAIEALLEQVDAMRLAAEGRVRELVGVLEHLAARIDRRTVDRLRRENPAFPSYMTPDDWLELFNRLLGEQRDRWSGNWEEKLTALERERDEWRARYHDAVARLEVERREAARLRQQDAERQARIAALERQVRELLQKRPRQEGTTIAPENRAAAAPAPGSGAVSVLLPPGPPVHAEIFGRWEREGAFLAFMAITGLSMEYEIRLGVLQLEQFAGINSPDSGSLKRLIRRLEKAHLVERRVVPVGQRRVAVITLTPLGREVCQAVGHQPVTSEWEILMRNHGGGDQEKHAALVILAAYHARRYGYLVEVCPQVEGAAAPDMLIEKEGERFYVEVEAESGSAERRMRKWRNQAELQGFAAVYAPNEAIRRVLVDEARRAASRGYATDADHLFGDPADFWAETW